MNHLTSPRLVAPLLASAGLWTLFVWGSRARLLTPEEGAGWSAWARIGGSILFGLILLALAWRARTTGYSGGPLVLITFSVWMVVLWIPSILSVAAGTETTAFKLVHLALAVVSLGFGAALAGQARRELNRGLRRARRPRTALPDTRSSS